MSFRFFHVQSGGIEDRILSESKEKAAEKFVSDIVEQAGDKEVKLGKIVIVDTKPITEEESETAYFAYTVDLAKKLGIEIDEDED